jgi:hypothetical protein
MTSHLTAKEVKEIRRIRVLDAVEKAWVKAQIEVNKEVFKQRRKKC